MTSKILKSNPQNQPQPSKKTTPMGNVKAFPPSIDSKQNKKLIDNLLQDLKPSIHKLAEHDKK